MKAGATLINRAMVEDVIFKGGKVAGVKILRDGGELEAPVVVAADGVLSFTALKAGLRRPKFNIDQMAVGVKALIDLPKEVIDDRFGLVGRPGVRQRIRRLHRRSSRRRLPLHQLRLGFGGARCPPREPPRERQDPLRPAQCLPGAAPDRQASQGWTASGVLGPRHPRGRVRHDSGDSSVTASLSPAMPPLSATSPVSTWRGSTWPPIRGFWRQRP